MALRTLGSLLTRRLSPRAQAQAEPWLLYSGGGGGDGEASILQWCVGRVGRSSASRQEHRGFGFRYDEFGVASDGIPVSCDLMLFMCTVAAVPAAGDAEEDAGTCSKMAKLTGVFISVF